MGRGHGVPLLSSYDALMRPTTAFAAALLTTVGVHLAAFQSPAPDVAAAGPQVGQRVPDFTLPDQSGTPRTLKSLLRSNGAMLVFFRSADW